MRNKGFIRVAAAVPQVKVADVSYNAKQIITSIKQAAQNSVSLVVFPELSLSSLSCGDLFRNTLLLTQAKEALRYILEETREDAIIAVFGLPISIYSSIYNVAAVCYKGELVALVPKTEANTNTVFCNGPKAGAACYDFYQEEVLFAQDVLFRCSDFCFSIGFSVEESMNQSGVDVRCCLTDQAAFATTEHTAIEAIRGLTQIQNCAALYVSPGFGESSTDLVYGGAAALVETGQVLVQNPLFQTSSSLLISEFDLAKIHALQKNHSTPWAVHGLQIKTEPAADFSLTRILNPHPFLAAAATQDTTYAQAYEIQALGLIQRLTHIGGEKVILGVSGGLDSTLALLVCMKAIDKLGLPRKNIIGVTMPGFGTTGRTYQNALVLMERMGITVREISIKEACLQHFKDIGHDVKVQDVTYENSQARERTQILMDIANQENALLVGTGDLSELALGWATYNGDHMSMYAVNASVPKTLVQDLVRWVALHETDQELSDTLLDILDTPISPELTPATDAGEIQQKTEDLVGPYELHDFYLYHTLKYAYSPKLIYERALLAFEGKHSAEDIKYWLRTFYRRFFSQQFKRSCMPDGPNVTGLSLSPRGGWRMPSDASVGLWMNAIDQL